MITYFFLIFLCLWDKKTAYNRENSQVLKEFCIHTLAGKKKKKRFYHLIDFTKLSLLSTSNHYLVQTKEQLSFSFSSFFFIFFFFFSFSLSYQLYIRVLRPRRVKVIVWPVHTAHMRARVFIFYFFLSCSWDKMGWGECVMVSVCFMD